MNIVLYGFPLLFLLIRLLRSISDSLSKHFIADKFSIKFRSVAEVAESTGIGQVSRSDAEVAESSGIGQASEMIEISFSMAFLVAVSASV